MTVIAHPQVQIDSSVGSLLLQPQGGFMYPHIEPQGVLNEAFLFKKSDSGLPGTGLFLIDDYFTSGRTLDFIIYACNENVHGLTIGVYCKNCYCMCHIY